MNELKLTYEEVEALVEELNYHYFSRDNPLASKVYDKLVTYVKSRQLSLPETNNELD